MMILKQNTHMRLLFVLATAGTCGIDPWHTEEIEGHSFFLHVNGLGIPIKACQNGHAPSRAWPDSREVSNVSSEF